MELQSPFKLSLIFLLVAAPSSMVLAQTPSPCNFNGFTLGLGLGVTTFMTDINSNVALTSDHPSFTLPLLAGLIAPTPGNAVTNSAKNMIYRYGAMGALYGGYGQVFNPGIYLGAELGLNLFGATESTLHAASTNNSDVSFTDNEVDFLNDALTNNSLNSNTKVTRNTIEPFLDLKLGFLMTPTALAYLKGGVNYNTIQVKSNASYLANGLVTVEGGPYPGNFPLSAAGSASLHNSNSRSGIGLRAGAGMEVMITPELGVGADYVYTFYRKVQVKTLNTSGTDVACDAYEGCQVVDATMTDSRNVTISDQQVMAQLIYHFG